MSNETVSGWADYWNEATISSLKVLNEERMAEKWNKRSGDFGRSMEKDKKKKKTEKTINFLKESGFEAKGARVLDIGCGTGALALPLARMGAEVTAMDISKGMLKKIEETAAEEGLNIRTMEGSWWSTDIDNLELRDSFDLVIAARTPAIRNAETMERMIACSRKLCYYIGFIRKSENSAHSDISRLILKEDYVRNTTNMFFPFMYLYLAGYNPEIEISYSENKKREIEWEAAAEDTMEFLGHGRDFDEDTRTKIRNYYRDLSKDGKYTEHVDVCEGMMLWSARKN